MAARTQFGTPGTAAASAARTPAEHSCIRNSAVAARTYFGTPPKTGQPVQQGLSVGEQPVQQAGPNTGAGQPAQQHMPKNMGCPPGMSPQQQQPAAYSLDSQRTAATTLGFLSPCGFTNTWQYQ